MATLRKCWLAFGLVIVAFTAGYVSTARQVPLFTPDSRYYAGMAFWFGGDSKHAAAERVAALAPKYDTLALPADVLFGWGLTQPRVVYPALSVPFVEVFGVKGLAVVSCLAMILVLLIATALLSCRWSAPAAVVPALLVCTSPSLMLYGSAMLTESLTALWGALLLWLAWRHLSGPTPALLAALAVLTVVAGFTRQSTLIPAGAFVAAWLLSPLNRGQRVNWGGIALVVGGTSLAVQLLQIWLFPGFSQVHQFEMKTGTDSLTAALKKAPDLAWHILRVDVERMSATDRPLLLLLGLAIVSMLVFWRRSESHLLLGALMAYELYNVTNGTPTTFRYGMPALMFVMTSVALLLSQLTPDRPDPVVASDPA